MSAIHEQTAMTGLVAIAVHGLTLLGDPWLNPGPAGIAIPFTIAYKTFWVGLGITGGYLAALLGLSFYLRRRIGPRLGRRVHRRRSWSRPWAMVHVLGAGTDASSPWLFWPVVASIPVVAGPFVLARVVQGIRRGPARARSAPDRRDTARERGRRASAGCRDPTAASAARDRGAGGRMTGEGTLIVGGGLASQRSIETLRARGYEGRIAMVCAEAELPYDRPPLSKGMLAGEVEESEVGLPPASWYADQCVELIFSAAPWELDAKRRGVRLDNDSELGYEDLLIATGSAPQILPQLDRFSNVHSLRTLADARRLRGAFRTGARLAIVGAGFIGQEVASTARRAGLDVTIIEALPAPLGRCSARTSAAG